MTIKLMFPKKPDDLAEAIRAELEKMGYTGTSMSVKKETTLPNGRFRVELS